MNKYTVAPLPKAVSALPILLFSNFFILFNKIVRFALRTKAKKVTQILQAIQISVKGSL
jgi:hypothetical protein